MVTTRRVLLLILLVGLSVRIWQLEKQTNVQQNRLATYEARGLRVFAKGAYRAELRHLVDKGNLQVIELRTSSATPFSASIHGREESSFGSIQSTFDPSRHHNEATFIISLSHSRENRSLSIDSIGSTLRKVPTTFELRSSFKIAESNPLHDETSMDLFSIDGEMFSLELSSLKKE